MELTMRLTTLFCLASTLCFAESWSGALVRAKCYNSEERNVNLDSLGSYIDRDKNMEIRSCYPKPKTGSFAVVLENGLSFRLDPAGNAKAAELVRRIGKKSLFLVAVTGERNRNKVKVNSISMATQTPPRRSL